MLIHHIDGIELEKEKPNTSEDFFNRSEATYEIKGVKHTFHLLYVRYFEEKLEDELKEHDFWKPLLQKYKIRELAALAALSKHDSYLKRKRVYLNDYEEFKRLFMNPDEKTITNSLNSLN
ncbi:hypothetical protein [Fictibacillus phosphorivorans]|uniref:hypothetical protein n=1 Tax=Fictibacillus phosphorivorans TaxID=1221500 RepID=UPI002041BCAA|nr:hypothetical protein [Fictibacillus phosphorivorans]MCM3719703.1 hypothetical protein [Fictibacillus phosphorivorans]MCM3777394.1 hypothetical protein [Fictibacillus phosphorivorans]